MRNRKYEVTSAARCNLAFGGMQGCYYGSNCMFFGFLIAYLTSKGYSNILVGLNSTIIAAATMLAQPLGGYIIDSFISPKKFLIISALISVPCTILFFMLDAGPAVSMMLIALIALFYSPLGGVIDSWSVRIREQGVAINYPVTRSMGSIFYSTSALIVGVIISRFGYSVMLPAHLIFLALMLISCFFEEDVPCKNKVRREDTTQQRIGLLQAFKILLTNSTYTIFLISYFFYNLGLRVVATFITPILQERGGTPAQVGMALFMAAFFELPILLTFNRYIMRLKLEAIYILSLSFGFFRVIAINMSDNVAAVMLAQFFQGISFGLNLPLLLEYISRIVPEKLRGTAITIALAAGAGAALILGNMVGGVLMDSFGTTTFINIMGGCMLVSIIIFTVPTLIRKKKATPREL